MKKSILVIALMSLSAVSAVAEDHPCKADQEKFCKDIPTGQGKLAKCMKEHESNLSDGCKAKIAQAREKMTQARGACEPDRVKFCKDVKPGGGRIVGCLKDHESSLSSACKSQFAPKKN